MAFNHGSFSSVYDIKSSYSMVIPEYQRGYSWGKPQWLALWDDAITIAGLQNIEQEHFAGTIMISNGDFKSDGVAEVDLVDGQQRWTSLSLLLKALGSDAFSIRYKDNDAMQTYFDYYATGKQELVTRLANQKSFYTRNIKNASLFFADKVRQIDSSKRQSLIDAVHYRFKIFVLTIQPSFDINVAFETINNRGKPLSTLEKLKNRLIYLASNFEDDHLGEKTKYVIHRCWKGIYGWLGQGKNLLDDDEFLRVHALGWFKHEKKADWLSSQLFEHEFSARSNVQSEVIERYVQSLEQAALWWYRINEPDTLPLSIRKALVSLGRTPSASTKPLLLWSLMRLAIDNPEITEDPLNKPVIFESFGKLIYQAERFAVLVILASARQANIGQSEIHRFSYSLAHPEASIRDENNQIDHSAVRAVLITADHLEYLIMNTEYDPDGDITSEPYGEGYFQQSGVQVIVEDRFRTRSGFYNWQLGKLLLYIWEERLRGDCGAPLKIQWEAIAWDKTVEHIYPQNPRPEWSSDIRFHGKKSKHIINSVKNSIGNLMLLSMPRNAAASNNPFSAVNGVNGKKDVYKNGCFSEVRVANLCQKWTIVQIAARGIAMWRLAQKTWNFELVKDSEPLTKWYPYIFGDQWEVIQKGATMDQIPINTKSLNHWVKKFEE